jgi:class 3 adenylate cyclase
MKREAITNAIMKDYFAENSFLSVDGKKEYPQYLVSISDQHQNYAVGLVDMIGSTVMATKLRGAQIGIYYEIFLNSMSKVLSRFGGVIIKNIGDCLLFFFPETRHENRKFGFMSCLECSLAMTEEHSMINQKLKEEHLPPMDYRISIDYGNVFVMKSNDSTIDLIGTPVNICAKMNHLAPKNGIAIGGDLFQIVKKFKEYDFNELKGYSVLNDKSYPIYSVVRNER